MYLLDTNCLIYFSKTPHAFTLNRDFTSMLSIIEHPPALNFDNLTVLSPRDYDFYKAIEISNKLRKQGPPKPAVDIVIAAMALTYHFTVISDDRPFHDVVEVEPELVVKSIADYLGSEKVEKKSASDRHSSLAKN